MPVWAPYKQMVGTFLRPAFKLIIRKLEQLCYDSKMCFAVQDAVRCLVGCFCSSLEHDSCGTKED